MELHRAVSLKSTNMNASKCAACGTEYDILLNIKGCPKCGSNQLAAMQPADPVGIESEPRPDFPRPFRQRFETEIGAAKMFLSILAIVAAVVLYYITNNTDVFQKMLKRFFE